MHGLNMAFESLRQVLPSLGSNKQFSKYETLQMAKSYIGALRDIVCTSDENMLVGSFPSSSCDDYGLSNTTMAHQDRNVSLNSSCQSSNE